MKVFLTGSNKVLVLVQVGKLSGELDDLRQKYANIAKDLSNARLALDESRVNSERLHHESELVVQNVNTWVREQK